MTTPTPTPVDADFSSWLTARAPTHHRRSALKEATHALRSAWLRLWRLSGRAGERPAAACEWSIFMERTWRDRRGDLRVRMTPARGSRAKIARRLNRFAAEALDDRERNRHERPSHSIAIMSPYMEESWQGGVDFFLDVLSDPGCISFFEGADGPLPDGARQQTFITARR